jgi:hypothetical protein
MKASIVINKLHKALEKHNYHPVLLKQAGLPASAVFSLVWFFEVVEEVFIGADERCRVFDKLFLCPIT